MPVELNRHTETILCAAVEISDPGQRALYLDEACGDDPVLRREVERMVDDHFRAGMFLERPSPALPATYLQPPAERPGTQIGRYKLLEQIGEGGMGVVYVAEQTEPVRRRVALKIIKPGMDTRQVISRFEAERQALAMMDHPNIAKVLDGGTTGESVGQALPDALGNRLTSQAQPDLRSGRPYFVMELVRGMPITEYCDQARLHPRGRLELFMTVCHAVQHAHQKGIIHRDIKPTNVLVTMHDDKPVVKVIDFGVAKAVNQQLTERTIYTAFTEMIGTPLYMSPEQAQLSGLDVDTRSDVYSLGVLLYELLTGHTPFDRDTLVKAGLDEVRRMIREDEPARPSHRISTLNAQAGSTVGQRRGFDQRQLTRVLHGELDWIVMKALEKDRNRRYESASAFAADIERHLKNEPVEAGPPSTLYRFSKFARRRRSTLVAVTVVAVSLLTGVGISLWQAAEANTARQQAETNYDIARQVVDDMYVQIAEKWLADEPQLEPLQRDFLLKAATFYEKFAEQEGDNPQMGFDVAVAHGRCAQVHEKLGEWEKGKAAYEKAIHGFEAILTQRPNDPKCRAELAKSHLGLAIMNNFTDVPAMLTGGLKSLELFRGLHREFPSDLEYRRNYITTASTMAHELFVHGRTDEERRSQMELESEAEQLARKFVSDEATADAYHILGDVLGRTETASSQDALVAERLCREAIDALEKASQLNRRSSSIRASLAEATFRWAVALNVLERLADARTASQRAIQILQPLIEDFPKSPGYRKTLGGVYMNLASIGQRDGQDLDGIREYWEKAIENYSQAWLPYEFTADFLLRARQGLIEVLVRQQDVEEIARQHEAYRKELRSLWEAPEANRSPERARARLEKVTGWLDSVSAELADHIGRRIPGASKLQQSLLEESIKLYDELLTRDPKNRKLRLARSVAIKSLANVYAEAADKPLQAKARDMLKQVVSIQEALSKEDPDNRQCLRQLGWAYIDYAGALGEASALDLRMKCLDTFRFLASKDPSDGEAQLEHAHALCMLAYHWVIVNEPAKAIELSEEAVRLVEGITVDLAEKNYKLSLAECYVTLAESYQRSDKPADAEQAFRTGLFLREQLLEEEPANPFLHNAVHDVNQRLARFLRERGRFDEETTIFHRVAQYYEQVYGQHPDDVQLRIELAELYNSRIQFFELKSMWREAIEQFPPYLKHVRRVWELQPASDWGDDYRNRYFDYANILYLLGQKDAAKEAYRETLRVAHVMLATPELPEDQKRDSKRYLAIIESTCPFRELCKFELPECEKLLAQLEPTGKSSPRRIEEFFPWLKRGEFRLRTGDAAGALADIKLFNDFGPKVDPKRGLDPYWIVRQAMCHDLLGRFEEGTKVYERAAWSREVAMRQLFWLAPDLWKMGRHDEARRMWAAAIERTRISFDSVPSDLVRFNLGVAHFRLGNYEASWQHLQESIDFLDRNDLAEHSGHGNSGHFYFIAMAHSSLGKKDEAQKWFERGRQWDKQHASSLQPQDRDSKRAIRQEAAKLLGIPDDVETEAAGLTGSQPDGRPPKPSE